MSRYDWTCSCKHPPIAEIEQRRLAAVSDTDIVLHHAAKTRKDLVRSWAVDSDALITDSLFRPVSS